MGVLDWARNAWAYLSRLAGLSKHCFKDVGRFEECDAFWAAVGILVGVICLLALFFIARHFFREYAAHRKAWRRRQAELEVAPSEVMEQHKWTGDHAIDPSLSQEEIIRRIKEAKARQRADAGPKSDPKPAGDPGLGSGIRHR
jgi:flagellar biosynthesis/type III secretory pathway M-ring protein FliF/YscJ